MRATNREKERERCVFQRVWFQGYGACRGSIAQQAHATAHAHTQREREIERERERERRITDMIGSW